MQEQDFSINLLLGHVLTVITHVHFTVLLEDTVNSSVDMSPYQKLQQVSCRISTLKTNMRLPLSKSSDLSVNCCDLKIICFIFTSHTYKSDCDFTEACLCLECTDLSCSGNGKCVLDDEDGELCQCFPGWTGSDCSVDIDFCDSSPCKNGGTCVEKQETFSCDCPPDWTGQACMTSESNISIVYNHNI